MSDPRADEQAVVCFQWETYWPHALLDPANVAATADRQAVTCAACTHALGSQKQEPPCTCGAVEVSAVAQHLAPCPRLRPAGGDDRG